MTRCETFALQQKINLEKFIKEEVNLRVQAARTLSEKFELDDINVRIAAGLGVNNEIYVYAGLDKLAAVVGAEIYKVDEFKYAFDYGGVKFLWTDYLGLWTDQNIREKADPKKPETHNETFDDACNAIGKEKTE